MRLDTRSNSYALLIENLTSGSREDKTAGFGIHAKGVQKRILGQCNATMNGRASY